ncbi:hypothetical protein [Methyloglobulus sp.]|uniref:hypothetical protein n=1 Tax=Methyloglobulus sp. TaxID=2518622 RepID=UPI0032B76E2C
MGVLTIGSVEACPVLAYSGQAVKPLCRQGHLKRVRSVLVDVVSQPTERFGRFSGGLERGASRAVGG